jgi:hypothetical protein
VKEFQYQYRPSPLTERKIFLFEHQSKEKLLRGQKVINVAQQETVSQSLASSKTITGDKRRNMLNSCTCGAGRLKRNEELFIRYHTTILIRVLLSCI